MPRNSTPSPKPEDIRKRRKDAREKAAREEASRVAESQDSQTQASSASRAFSRSGQSHGYRSSGNGQSPLPAPTPSVDGYFQPSHPGDDLEMANPIEDWRSAYLQKSDRPSPYTSDAAHTRSLVSSPFSAAGSISPSMIVQCACGWKGDTRNHQCPGSVARTTPPLTSEPSGSAGIFQRPGLPGRHGSHGSWQRRQEHARTRSES